MGNIKEPLERILAREWNQSLKPYEYHITPEFNRLIDAGWAYKRMSMHGYWIIGWTELGWAAATVCGLCEVDTNLILEMGAEIERQREEIAALRKFETIDGVLKNYRYQEMHALQMTEAKIARWTSEEITLHRSEREQVLLEAINILQSENNTLKRRLGRSLVINVGRRTQAKNLKQTIARLTENLSEWKRAFLDKDKAHRKLSAVLRMHWTPEEWHEKRRLTALAHPELFDGDKE